MNGGVLRSRETTESGQRRMVVHGSAGAQVSRHIGMKIRTLTLALRKLHKLTGDVKGALMAGVNLGSPAEEKGISTGDAIVEAGGKPAAAAKDVASLILNGNRSEQ